MRTAETWFREAAQHYVEKHQACPWCHGAHRVYHLRQNGRVSYYCQECDFQVSHESAADRYGYVPGAETDGQAAETLLLDDLGQWDD